MTTQEHVVEERETGLGAPAGRLLSAVRALFTDAAGIAWDRLSFSLFVVAAILVVLTFRDYGVTWDEDVHNMYGVYVLDYYTSIFQNTRALNWLNLYNYGAAFDMIAAALNRVSPIGTYETRHLFNGLVGVLGVIGCWKLGRILGGKRVGFIAALFILATPNYYGQMFNNPKDIPFAVAVVWATYYMVRIVPALPAPRWSLLVKLGISIGLGLGVRVGGLLLICYLGLLLGLWGAWRIAETRDPRRLASDAGRVVFRAFVPVVAVAYPVMLLFWPWAQIHPIDNPLRSLEFFTHETFPFRTLFFGEYVPATDLPWSYLPTYIVLALPELVLILLALTPIFALVLLRRVPSAKRRDTVLQYFVLAFGIVFPVAYAVAVKAVLFDGMRHFIFVLPLIAAASALVADRLLDWIATLRARKLIRGGLGLYGAAHIAIMVMLHPDQYVYYNGFVGGVAGAQGLFKLDYWANSYAEAVDGLEDFLRAEYGADFADHDFRVAVCGPPISADYFFPKNFIFTSDRENADFFIAFTKDNCHTSIPGRQVYRVERMGALLSVVIDHREICAKRNRPRDVARRTVEFAVGSELD